MVWCKMQMQFMHLFKLKIWNYIQHDLGFDLLGSEISCYVIQSLPIFLILSTYTISKHRLTTSDNAVFDVQFNNYFVSWKNVLFLRSSISYILNHSVNFNSCDIMRSSSIKVALLSDKLWFWYYLAF